LKKISKNLPWEVNVKVVVYLYTSVRLFLIIFNY